MLDLDPGRVANVTALLIGRVGDLIVGSAFLRALNRRYPKARIQLVIHEQCRETAALIPTVDDVQTLRRFHKAAANIKLAAHLMSCPCDLLVDLNPSPSRTSAALAALVRAPHKLGFRKGRLDSSFTESVQPAGEKEHMLDRYARLAGALGAPYIGETELRLNPADEARGDRVIAGLGGKAEGRRVLVHPGNFKKHDNRWPEEKFVELCDRLGQDGGLRLFFACGPGEEEKVAQINGQLKKPAVLLPPFPIGVTGAVMQRMDLCLMNVTGTMHLAAALGVPTFGFYSGYTNTVWRPRGARHTGAVSKSWTSCRDIGVDEAYAAVQIALALNR